MGLSCIHMEDLPQTGVSSMLDDGRRNLASGGLHALLPVLILLFSGCGLVSQYSPRPLSTYRGHYHFQDGIASAEQGRYEQAEESLAKAVELCGDEYKFQHEYARVLAEVGKLEEAIAHYERAVVLKDGSDATLLVELAQKRLEYGQREHAHAAVEKAIELEPNSPEAWRVRGEVLQAFRLPYEALADYHRALSLSPDDEELPLKIADIYLMLDKPDRALVAIQRLEENWPEEDEPANVLHLKGLALAGMGRHREAEHCLAAVVDRIDTPSAGLLFQLAQCRYYLGDATAAQDTVHEALALDPQHEPSRYLLRRLGSRQIANTPR